MSTYTSLLGLDLPGTSAPTAATAAKVAKKKAAYAAAAHEIKLLRALRGWHQVEHKQHSNPEDVEAAREAGGPEGEALSRSSGSFVGWHAPAHHSTASLANRGHSHSGAQASHGLASAFRHGRVGADGVVPNEIFRASVVQRALKSAVSHGLSKPTTKDFYKANSSVKADLERNGLRVGIPGGRPGRVTR